MKKLFIIASIILVAIASLPLIGNKLIDAELNTRIATLVSNGVDVQKEVTDSKYLDTKRHYEFVIKDSDKFIQYLAKFSHTQIPPYINSLLDGTRMGMDLHYNNIPISKAVSIDLYPLALSQEAMQEIQAQDTDFAIYVENFLNKAGLSYHLDYNVVTQEFDGKIKDIDENYTFTSGEKLKAKLYDSVFSGKGLLIAPESIRSSTKLIHLDVTNKTNRIIIDLNNTQLKSDFESRSTYQTQIQTDILKLNINDEQTGKTVVNLDNPKMSFSSSTKGPKAQLKAKISFDDLNFESKNQTVLLTDFNYDLLLKDIDKDTYEALSKLIESAKQKTDPSLESKIQKQLEQLFMRGFELQLYDLGIKKIMLNKVKDLEGISINSEIKLAPNSVSNINLLSAIGLLDKIDLDLYIEISKPLFVLITESNPMVALSQGYAKEKVNSLVYDIKMKKGAVSVNGKRIK